MIRDASTFARDIVLEADLVVVGSGAGGGMAAMVAAEAGLRVVVVESGGFVPPEAMTQCEHQMVPRLLWDGGGRTTADRVTRVHQGRALGGSTVHNLNLCKRIPDPILREWTATRGLTHLPASRWETLYAEVEALLGVADVPESGRTRHNLLLQAGCEALGWRGGWMQHNRDGCVGSGFCEVGCAFDAKMNVTRVLLPRAIEAGAQVLTFCSAARVRHRRGAVLGVDCFATDPHTGARRSRIRIDAPRVCVSASATGTPALLLRSGVRDPGGETGRRLRLHPALVAAGEFDEPVHAWRGIPQSYECTQHLDFEAAHAVGAAPPPIGVRTWIVPAFAHPMGTATMLPGHGAAHRRLMASYANMAVLTAMVHDRTAGSVRPRGEDGVRIDWTPGAEDAAELLFGLRACAQVLFAAGARRVIVPVDPVVELAPGDDLAWIESIDLSRGRIDITSVHPMGAVPMGDDPTVAAVDSRGAHHHVAGLWVADGSLFPTSIGIPPQLSIYALGRHVGEAIAAS
jgi:choline dehydrogenase-like flavoprotein